MSEENIRENENTELAENTAAPEVQENTKPARKPNYLLMFIVCGYLAYLGIKLGIDLMKGAVEAEPRWLFIVASVLFLIVGFGYGIVTLIRFIKEQQLDQAFKSAYKRYEDEEDEKSEDEEE